MARVKEERVTTSKGLQVVINHPEIEDAEELLEASRLVVDASPYLLSETPEFHYTVEQERSIINIYLTHPSELLLVARVKGKIVGMITYRVGFRRKISHQGEIGMAILPEYQTQGIGQALLDATIKWVKNHPNLEQIRLQVFKKNQAAIKLYQKNDFIIEGEQRNGVKYLDGTYDDVVCMLLQL